MKKSLTSIAFLPLAIFSLSCSQDDSSKSIEQPSNPYLKYKGDWQGTFSGGDSGTWEATVNDKGSIVGKVKSNALPLTNFTLEGKVSEDGNVSINYIYVGSKIGEFTGIMTSSSSNGNWFSNSSAGNWKGTWSGTKK